MIILGVDPGYAIVGFSVLSFQKNTFNVLSYGAITTESDMKYEDRLVKIGDGISELIEKFKPAYLSIESLFFTSNQKTAIAVAGARGAIIMTARKRGLEIFSYTPLQVKQAVVGYGRATKGQVIEMTKTLLNLKEKPKLDDTSDALALAICHAHSFNSALHGI